MSDTGDGMDEATLKNIFEPFFTTKGAKGTGLGLATVYSIVQQSNGSIDVASAPGKGATIRILLPRIEGTIEPSLEVQPVIPQARESATILVVEDEKEVRTFAVRALASRGYRVLAASDGPEAIAIARAYHERIDILLTDVILPGMNGRELAEYFQTTHTGIKVIYTSGYTQDLITDRGILYQDIAYVPKPYTAEQIVIKVREAIK